MIALATIGSIAFFLTALSPGRYLSGWAGRAGPRLAMASRRAAAGPRARSMPTGNASGSLTSNNRAARWRARSRNTPPALQRLLQYAGLDPDHALVRWGNFDRTVLLPSTVFEPDETGRSYRFRPNTRSIWIRNFPMRGPVKAYFQVPDRPELAEVVKGTTAQIVDGSTQTTNSWGLRGPSRICPRRGAESSWATLTCRACSSAIDETPVECLKRDLKARLGGPSRS